MTWRDEFTAEQLDMVATGGKPPKLVFVDDIRPCNAPAPEHVEVCGRYLGATKKCQKVSGHPGGHSSQPTGCNRPAGHQGPHTFIVYRDAQKLGEW